MTQSSYINTPDEELLIAVRFQLDNIGVIANDISQELVERFEAKLAEEDNSSEDWQLGYEQGYNDAQENN